MVKKIASFVSGKPDLVDIQGYFKKDLPWMLACVAGLTDPKVSKQY
jgi:hypothetical protein